MPYRAALKSICTETSNISSAALLRLPDFASSYSPSCPRGGQQSPSIHLEPALNVLACFKLLSEAGGDARVWESFPWGRVRR